MKPLWLSDYQKWAQLPLPERLEELRKYYCTGPCGQSSATTATRAATGAALREAIDVAREIEDARRDYAITTQRDISQLQSDADDQRLQQMRENAQQLLVYMNPG